MSPSILLDWHVSYVAPYVTDVIRVIMNHHYKICHMSLVGCPQVVGHGVPDMSRYDVARRRHESE
eukprot:7354958-Alexandrium_andersonii.AAC.1